MTKDKPIVDINIITYNNGKEWLPVLERVQNQTYDNIRINIMDDFSSDGTYEHTLDAAKKDKRIHIYRNGINTGMVPNYQRAFWWGDSDFIMLKSADDLIDPPYLEKLMERALDNPALAQCSTFAHEIDESNGVKKTFTAKHYMRTVGDDILEAATKIMWTYAVAPPYWGIFRRSAIQRCLPIGYYSGSDHVFFCELGLYGAIDFVEEYLFHRVGGPHNIAQNARRLSVFNGRGVNLDSKFADIEHFIPTLNMIYHHYDMFTKARIDDQYRLPLINRAQQVLLQRFEEEIIRDVNNLKTIADQIIEQVTLDKSPQTATLNRLYLQRLMTTLSKVAMVLGGNLDIQPTIQKVLTAIKNFY